MPSFPLRQQPQKVGTQFHLLMKQRLMDLPVTPLLETYPQFAEWMRNLYSMAPYNATMHSKTRSRLRALLTQLNSWLTSWHAGEDFPTSIQQEFPKANLTVSGTDTQSMTENIMPGLGEIEEIAI